jgi:hypothetical protein
LRLLTCRKFALTYSGGVLRPTVRVLLAGVSHFNEALIDSLESDLTEVVGCAATADDAVRMAEELQPDVVVGDVALVQEVTSLSGPGVVFVRPHDGGDADAGLPRVDVEHDLLEALIAIASITPRRESEDRPLDGNGH